MTGAYDILFTVTLVALGVAMLAALLRAIIGPRVADRLVGINMTGTAAIMLIAVLSVMLDAGYLTDIAIIYALLSFLAVVVLTRLISGRKK